MIKNIKFEADLSEYDYITQKEKFKEYQVISNLTYMTDEPTHTKHLIGKYLIVDISQHSHLLIDGIGTYEYLKQYVPDLKILLIKYGDMGRQNVFYKNSGPSKVVKDIIDIYQLTEDNFIDPNKNENVSIENVVSLTHTVSDMESNIGHKIFMEDGKSLIEYRKENQIDPNEDIRNDNVCAFLRQFVVNKLKDYLVEGEHKKIFTTRIPITISLMLSTNVNWDFIHFEMNEERTNVNLKELDPFTKYAVERYDYIENQQKIEQSFIDKGYEIFRLEGMGLIEQANLFYNASHVAGLSGTNIANAIFCKPGTYVYDIINIPRHIYTYDWYKTFFIGMDLNYKKTYLFDIPLI